MVEHLFCKQVVRGSSPLVSSSIDTHVEKIVEAIEIS